MGWERERGRERERDSMGRSKNVVTPFKSQVIEIRKKYSNDEIESILPPFQ